MKIQTVNFPWPGNLVPHEANIQYFFYLISIICMLQKQKCNIREEMKFKPLV